MSGIILFLHQTNAAFQNVASLCSCVQLLCLLIITAICCCSSRSEPGPPADSSKAVAPTHASFISLPPLEALACSSSDPDVCTVLCLCVKGSCVFSCRYSNFWLVYFLLGLCSKVVSHLKADSCFVRKTSGF